MKSIAVIAAGRIGKMYCRLLNEHFPGVRLKTVIDRRQTLADLKTLSIEAERVDGDIQTVLEDREIDRVVVAASTPAHIELCKSLLASGKAVLCEKPLSFNEGEIESLGEYAERVGGKLQVAYVRRFDPDFSELRRLILAGEAGQIHMVKIVNRDPFRPDLKFAAKSGGIFLDFMVHDFDMIYYLTGKRVVQTYVAADTKIDPKLAEWGDYDTVLAVLKTEDGILASLDCSRETRYGYDQRIEVFGSKGCFRVENEREHGITRYQEHLVTGYPPKLDFRQRYFRAFVGQLASFMRLADGTAQPEVGWREALHAVRTANACKVSCMEERPVSIDHE